MKKYKSLLYSIPLLIALGLMVLVYGGMRLPAPVQPVVEIEKKIPSGIGIDKTPALINVFASWCYECVLEMPTLLELSSRVHVYGLNYWDKDATSWLKKHGNPYEKVIYDPQGLMSAQLSVVGVPETFLVDRDGIIRKKIIGQIDQTLVQDVIRPWMEENEVPR